MAVSFTSVSVKNENCVSTVMAASMNNFSNNTQQYEVKSYAVALLLSHYISGTSWLMIMYTGGEMIICRLESVSLQSRDIYPSIKMCLYSFTCSRTPMGCLPHIVFPNFFKYSVKAAGFKVSMISIPCNTKYILDKVVGEFLQTGDTATT